MTPEHSRLRDAVIEATSTLGRVLTTLRLALSASPDPARPDNGVVRHCRGSARSENIVEE
jgi:hypothetical protein